MKKEFDEEKFVGDFIDKWSATFVPRRSTQKATAGAYTPKYMANEDCAGRGPDGRFRLGGQICYPTENFARWLATRVSMVKGRKPSQADQSRGGAYE